MDTASERQLVSAPRGSVEATSEAATSRQVVGNRRFVRIWLKRALAGAAAAATVVSCQDVDPNSVPYQEGDNTDRSAQSMPSEESQGSVDNSLTPEFGDPRKMTIVADVSGIKISGNEPVPIDTKVIIRVVGFNGIQEQSVHEVSSGELVEIDHPFQTAGEGNIVEIRDPAGRGLDIPIY